MINKMIFALLVGGSLLNAAQATKPAEKLVINKLFVKYQGKLPKIGYTIQYCTGDKNWWYGSGELRNNDIAWNYVFARVNAVSVRDGAEHHKDWCSVVLTDEQRKALAAKSAYILIKDGAKPQEKSVSVAVGLTDEEQKKAIASADCYKQP